MKQLIMLQESKMPKKEQEINLREAVANALMHRDYNVRGTSLNIEIFDDRIEFMNPGTLPKPFETIMKEDFTQPRNPTVARIFRSIKLSENAGSGFEKMFTGWKSCYAHKPSVQNDVDYYKITFNLELDKKFKAEGVEIGGVSGTLIGTLSGTLNVVFNYIKENPGIQATQISERIKRPIDTIKKQIKQLADKSLIIRKGSRKTGGYYVK